jgi:hypothetical protein
MSLNCFNQQAIILTAPTPAALCPGSRPSCLTLEVGFLLGKVTFFVEQLVQAAAAAIAGLGSE